MQLAASALTDKRALLDQCSAASTDVSRALLNPAHGLSPAACSACSACACNDGACSVGMRTSVCGKDNPASCCCSSVDDSSFGLGSLAVLHCHVSVSKHRLASPRRTSSFENTIHNVLEAMLIARSTLCQLPMTVAIAAWVIRQHECGKIHQRGLRTFCAVVEGRKLLLKCFHLGCNVRAQVTQLLQAVQLRPLLFDARDKCRGRSG